MRVVLQLERFGDLVQSLPAIDLVARHGEKSLLVVQESVLPWARELVSSGCEIRAVESSLMQRFLAQLKPGSRREDRDRVARDIVKTLRVSRASLVINMTWHAAGAYLASSLPTDALTGPYVSDRGERLYRGFWARYPIVSVDGLPDGRVHMRDVRRLLVEESLGTARIKAGDAPVRHENDGPIVIVVGASDPRRTWPHESQRRLASMLSKVNGAGVVLVGGIREADLGRRIELAGGGRVLNKVAKLGPKELRDALQQARLVIGADTGPTHLACHLGIPVLMLMAGRAHVWETGPTGDGDLVIQGVPEGNADARSIEFDIVAAAARSMLGSGRFVAPDESKSRVLRAHVVSDADGIGGVVYDGEAGASRVTRVLLAGSAGSTIVEPDVPRLASLLRLGGSIDDELRQIISKARDLAIRGREQASLASSGLSARDSKKAAAALRVAGDTMSKIAGTLLASPVTRSVGIALQLQTDEIGGTTPSEVVRALETLFSNVARALDHAVRIAGCADGRVVTHTTLTRL